MWGTKHGMYLARDQNDIDKSLESAAVPCHFALIFHEQKLHQASRQRGERRGERKSRSVSLHNLAKATRENPGDKCHL